MARAIQTEAVRTQPLAAWVIVRDQADYPGIFVTWLVTTDPNIGMVASFGSY